MIAHLSSDLVDQSTTAIVKKMHPVVRQHYRMQDEIAFNDALSLHVKDAHSREQFEKMFQTRKWLAENQPQRLSFPTVMGMPDVMPTRSFNAMPPMLKKAYLHLDDFVTDLNQLVFRKVVTKQTADRWQNYFNGRKRIHLSTSASESKLPPGPIAHESGTMARERVVPRTPARKHVSLQTLMESLPTVQTRPSMNRNANGALAKSAAPPVIPPIRKGARNPAYKNTIPVAKSPRHRRKLGSPERAPFY